jgi:hypothetical protein
MVKSVELKGYGTIMINPIKIKENENETCDAQGNPVTSKLVGDRAKTMHYSIIYSALDRAFYNVVTDHEKIKQLVLVEHKSLKMPLVFGSGYKLWSGVLTNWNGKLLLVACRGDLVKELEKYSEDTVEFSIEALPQAKNMKKLVKALIM